ARPDEAGDHRHVVTDHVVEIERGVSLIDQCGDVADVHGLMQVDELPGLPQAIEELAEILLHRGAPKGAVVGGSALSYVVAKRPEIADFPWFFCCIVMLYSWKGQRWTRSTYSDAAQLGTSSWRSHGRSADSSLARRVDRGPGSKRRSEP